MTAVDGPEAERELPIRADITPTEIRMRFRQGSISMELFEVFTGSAKLIKLPGENTIQFRLHDPDTEAEGTLRAKFEENELRELHEAIGGMLEDE